MIKKHPLRFTITLVFALISSFLVFSQEIVLEMPLATQVSKATQIVEGKIVAKKAHWNLDRTFIYTVNTVEVFKVFKGEHIKTINIVTPGGFIDGEGVLVTPSLKLHINEVGVFLLNEKEVSLSYNNDDQFFRPTGSIQGFYRYDIYEDIYANTFTVEKGISDMFYKELVHLTKREFIDLKNFDVDSLRQKTQRLAAPNDITSISPLTTSAGTADILTISGSGFGGAIGRVSFPDADNGGRTYLDAYNSHIVSWSDTEILLRVPSFAGSGVVRVRPNDGGLFFSDNLTISYAHTNVEEDDSTIASEDRVEYITQLYNRDGNGGYEWLYNSNINSNDQAKESFERAFFNWVCSTGVNWELAGSTTRRPNIEGESRDGFNVVGFRDDVDDASSSDGTVIAYAISRYSGCANSTGDIDVFVEDTDLVFNSDLNYHYGFGDPVGSEIDFETVSLHELGHAHQLNHIIDPGALMHFAVNGGNAVRDLEPNDITGGTAVFNRSANDQICSQPVMTASECSLSTQDLQTYFVSIYPNPVSDILTINMNSSNNLLKYDLIDSHGSIVLSKATSNGNGDIDIDVSTISQGIYFLNISFDTGTATKKVIIN